MRALAVNVVAGAAAYQEAGMISGAAHNHGLAAGVLLLFFAMLGNSIFAAWWHG